MSIEETEFTYTVIRTDTMTEVLSTCMRKRSGARIEDGSELKKTIDRRRGFLIGYLKRHPRLLGHKLIASLVTNGYYTWERLILENGEELSAAEIKQRVIDNEKVLYEEVTR